MKKKKTNALEFWYKTAKAVAVVACVFWLIETGYFLIVDGWHWRASDPAEVWADGVVQALFGMMAFALAMCLLEIIEKEIELRRAVRAMIAKAEKQDAEKALAGLKDEDLQPLHLSNNFYLNVTNAPADDGPWIIRRDWKVPDEVTTTDYLVHNTASSFHFSPKRNEATEYADFNEMAMQLKLLRPPNERRFELMYCWESLAARPKTPNQKPQT